MDAAGSANRRTSRRALSRSRRLLYDSSLPCRTLAVARFGPRRRRARRRRRPAGAGSRRSGEPGRSGKLEVERRREGSIGVGLGASRRDPARSSRRSPGRSAPVWRTPARARRVRADFERRPAGASGTARSGMRRTGRGRSGRRRARGSWPRPGSGSGRRCRCSRRPPRRSTPGLATVASNGYRLTTTRSIGSIPWAPSVARSSGTSRRARMPPWSFGVERLDPAAEDLGLAGVGRDLDDLEPGLGQGRAVPPLASRSTPRRPGHGPGRSGRACRRRSAGPGGSERWQSPWCDSP